MSIDLTSRLEGIKQTGSGRWIARCPAHADRSPSLSVALRDGLWLIKCFAGCAAVDITDALGITLADLFPDRPNDLSRGTFRFKIPASDALRIIADEALAVGLIAARLLDSREIKEEQWSRLTVAIQRIRETNAYASPRR